MKFITNENTVSSRPRLIMMPASIIIIHKQGKQDNRKSGIEVLHKTIMNALNMNSNLQSQQSRRRAQSQKITSQDQKSEDSSASDNNMLMQRKTNNTIPKSSGDRISKNPVDETLKSGYVRAPSSVKDDEAATENVMMPHPNDVLCGRGGSINAHTGNVVFRRWIQERRESYNLADTKSAKTRITSEIFRRVKSLKPPGRFLHKIDAPGTSGGIIDDEEYWSEVDDTKALAKISQALREGAPAFRAAHGKTRKSQRSSQRRNSAPGSKKTEADCMYKTRSSKRRKTESPEAAYHRSTMAADLDISPPYYNDNSAAAAAGGDIRLDVDNYDSVFNHNHLQSYKNSPIFSNMGHPAAHEGYAGIASNDNRFDVPKPLNAHPLVNMFDYHASMSDVASAIPPTPLVLKPRMTSFTGIDSLPSLYAQAPASPYAMQYEQFDPYSFLSPVPTNNRAEVSKQNKLKREHSLSFSESELDTGDFTNPFDHDEEQAKEASLPNKHTTQWLELPYTSPNDPFPSPHVTPPNRGLSFENIGHIPSGHFLGSRKSSVTSSGERAGSQMDNASAHMYSNPKREGEGPKQN
jgi:hypothetical protein